MGDDARVGRHFREEIVGTLSTEDVGDERSQGIRAANAAAVPEISLPSVCGAAEVHPSQEFGIHFLPAAPEQVSAAAGASVRPVRTARTWRSRYEEVNQTLWRRAILSPTESITGPVLLGAWLPANSQTIDSLFLQRL